MPLSITKHEPYKLKLPKFVCDYVLKPDVPPPFDRLVSGFRLTVFCGRPASGKTSLMVSCLLDSKILKKAFNHIIVCMPQTSRNSLKKNPFKDLDPAKLFEDLDDIGRIYEMVEHYGSQEESTLIIIDDMQSYLKLPSVSKVLNHIVANRRHLRTSILILMQTLNLLPLKTRKLVNTLVTFRPSRKEWQTVCEEMLDTSDQKLQEEIYNYAFRSKGEHAWLLVDVSTGRLFSEFDEIEYGDTHIDAATESKKKS